MPASSYYDILSVGKKAKPAEIKRAYKKLARKCHPDLHPGNRQAEEQFKRITEAYEVLSDPSKRRRYDRTGAAPPGSPLSGGFPGFGAGGINFSGAGFSRGFAEIFDEILGGETAPRTREPRRGEDRVHSIRTGFFEALRGFSTTLELNGEAPCERCGGAGTVASARVGVCRDCQGTGNIERLGGTIRFTSRCRRCGGTGQAADEPCRPCHGTGRVPRRERIQIRIPAGVDTGSRVRVAAKGGPGILGGPPGDLYIQIQVEPHSYFSRSGDQILCTVPISFTEAALGSKIQVPTIEGTATVRIPPRTQGGQKLRLRGKGAPSLSGRGRGDQIVEVKVVTPDVLDERARALLRELAEFEPKDLRSHLGDGS